MLLDFSVLGEYFVKKTSLNFEKRGHRFTGAFQRSLKYKVTENGRFTYITVLGFEYGLALQFGRKPSMGGGNGVLIKNIKAWTAQKAPELNPYAVAKRIHKEGTKRYRQVGNSNARFENEYISDTFTDENLKASLVGFDTKQAKKIATEIQTLWQFR